MPAAIAPVRARTSASSRPTSASVMKESAIASGSAKRVKRAAEQREAAVPADFGRRHAHAREEMDRRVESRGRRDRERNPDSRDTARNISPRKKVSSTIATSEARHAAGRDAFEEDCRAESGQEGADAERDDRDRHRQHGREPDREADARLAQECGRGRP